MLELSSDFSSWTNCFRGSLWKANSNLRRAILGTSLQMMQQWTGVNFIFFFGTIFFQQLGTISNLFLIDSADALFSSGVPLVCSPVNSLPPSWVLPSPPRIKQPPRLRLHSSAWLLPSLHPLEDPPGAWVLIGEIFPLPIRSRGVGLSTASNSLRNTIIAVITPFMVGKDKGNLGPKVFFVWGTLCTCACIYAYFLVPETKGLSLEQVDKMIEEVTPRNSAGWKPTTTFANAMGMTKQAGVAIEEVHVDVEKRAGSQYQLLISVVLKDSVDGLNRF
ncbi:sugar transporter family protein, partial [Aureobasidium melanogenum]